MIWRSAMLSGSETFVRNHGQALTRWRSVYLGATKQESALSEESDLVVYPDSAAGRRAFLRLRLTGSSPRLTRLLGRLRPDLVHAHFGGDGWLVSHAAAQAGAPLLVTVHGHDVTRQPDSSGVLGGRYRRNLRTMFDRAAVVLAVSEHIRGKAIALGADPEKVLVHHTGVPITPAWAMPKRWDVVFVGRFVEKKGVDDLIDALGALPTPRPRALLIGDGPLRDRMRARAAGLGLDATFLGAQTPAQVTRHLAESRLLAAPSKTAADGDSEGLPTTILEAAVQGVPTVSTRHSGIPEAVAHGETGLLGAEGDSTAIAHHIQKLLGNPGLRERLGRQARERVETRFDLLRQSDRLERLYDAIRADAAPGERSAAPPGRR
ncbi:glycosyltransferase [Actinoplanes sp. NPDC049668]|uniref:glycosyltransferase n=1 Tax=unclassified Actinoplanes TaxID=2626549 RepID=UPI0033A50497